MKNKVVSSGDRGKPLAMSRMGSVTSLLRRILPGHGICEGNSPTTNCAEIHGDDSVS